ncbi:MAG: zinc-binding dehydrogenase [Rhizobium sp.]|nr:zinc-binding dehydrogenase [Rhizobium sp.]
MSLPARMCAVQLTGHGGPDALLWRDDLPLPVPAEDEVLVQIFAAGVNNTDIATRVGWYAPESTGPTGEGQAFEDGSWSGAMQFPRIQGAEFCGRVVAVGRDVTGWAFGRRVVCPTNMPEATPDAPTAYRALGSDIDGAFAQFCVVPARHLHDVTASPLSDVEIAAMPCAFGTAEGLLARAGVRHGDRVFIAGASGGVGLAAVQLARLRGADVTGQCAAEKAQDVRDAGAAYIIGRTDVPERDSFDKVIDIVGGEQVGARIAALRAGGHYAVAGAIAGPIVNVDLRTLYLRDITLHGCTYQSREVFAGLVELINDGRARPRVSRAFPLQEIATAQAEFQSKRHAGKIVLTMPEVFS